MYFLILEVEINQKSEFWVGIHLSFEKFHLQKLKLEKLYIQLRKSKSNAHLCTKVRSFSYNFP